MIDKQAEVFTRVMQGIIGELPELSEDNFSSDSYEATSVFPHISIEQIASATAVAYEDNDFVENKATLTFDVNIYSNLLSGKREQCTQIMALVDKYMYRMNFIRLTYAFATDVNHNAIARLVARYQVLADENNFYRTGR